MLRRQARAHSRHSTYILVRKYLLNVPSNPQNLSHRVVVVVQSSPNYGSNSSLPRVSLRPHCRRRAPYRRSPFLSTGYCRSVNQSLRHVCGDCLRQPNSDPGGRGPREPGLPERPSEMGWDPRAVIWGKSLPSEPFYVQSVDGSASSGRPAVI